MGRMKEREKVWGEEKQNPNVQPLTFNYTYLVCYFPCLMASGTLKCWRKFKILFFVLKSRTLHCKASHTDSSSPRLKKKRAFNIACRSSHINVSKQTSIYVCVEEAKGKGNKFRNKPGDKAKSGCLDPCMAGETADLSTNQQESQQ